MKNPLTSKEENRLYLEADGYQLSNPRAQPSLASSQCRRNRASVQLAFPRPCAGDFCRGRKLQNVRWGGLVFVLQEPGGLSWRAYHKHGQSKGAGAERFDPPFLRSNVDAGNEVQQAEPAGTR